MTWFGIHAIQRQQVQPCTSNALNAARTAPTSQTRGSTACIGRLSTFIGKRQKCHVVLRRPCTLHQHFLKSSRVTSQKCTLCLRDHRHAVAVVMYPAVKWHSCKGGWSIRLWIGPRSDLDYLGARSRSSFTGCRIHQRF